MSERIQPQQCDEQNREYVPSTRSIYYDGRIANALFPPSYPNNDPDTPTWKDGLREIEAFDWLRNDDNEMYNEGEASPLETILTPNPATIVEGCSEYGKTSSLPYGYALSDPTPALDHLSSETATTRVPEVFKPYKPVPSCTSPPGILEPTPIYEPTNPVHGLRPYLSAQSYSSTPVRPSTPPYQNPYTDPVVQTPQNVQAPRSLEYLQSMRYSPPLVTIRERKVPGDEVLVEMLYNTVEYFNNMKIREPAYIAAAAYCNKRIKIEHDDSPIAPTCTAYAYAYAAKEPDQPATPPPATEQEANNKSKGKDTTSSPVSSVTLAVSCPLASSYRVSGGHFVNEYGTVFEDADGEH